MFSELFLVPGTSYFFESRFAIFELLVALFSDCFYESCLSECIDEIFSELSSMISDFRCSLAFLRSGWDKRIFLPPLSGFMTAACWSSENFISSFASGVSLCTMVFNYSSIYE